MKPTLQPREITLEYRNIATQDIFLEEQIGRTLKKIEQSLKLQLSKYNDWNSTLRVQAILLCTSCSQDKSAQVEYKNTTKHTRLAVCIHIQDEEANN